MDVLGLYCCSFSVFVGMILIYICSMWYLGMWIEGELKDFDMFLVVLVGLLYLMFVVCGVLMCCVYDLIGVFEFLLCDFYVGVVGWCDVKGDGVW